MKVSNETGATYDILIIWLTSGSSTMVYVCVVAR